MAYKQYLSLGIIACSLICFNACHSDKGGSSTLPGLGNHDTTTTTRVVSVVISSIPFPINILDTLHMVTSKFQEELLNPASNVNIYSESNAGSANLGVYGADLAYVISFEQYQSVGTYVKATKLLADNIGIPLAFTEKVIQRCQKNQSNKDSLSTIVVQSYNMIDQTLKQNDRNASEVLVLTGGWVEGIYCISQSLGSVTDDAGKHRVHSVLMEQKQYADKLLSLLNQVSTKSTYCQGLVAPMQEIKTAYDGISSDSSFTDENVKALTSKVKNLRSLIVKGKS